jgi:hypothetical protein
MQLQLRKIPSRSSKHSLFLLPLRPNRLTPLTIFSTPLLLFFEIPQRLELFRLRFYFVRPCNFQKFGKNVFFGFVLHIYRYDFRC